MVIIFVIEAGGTGLSASYSKSTLPVERSVRIADLAEILIPSAKAVVPKTKTMQTDKTTETSFFMLFTLLKIIVFDISIPENTEKFVFCNLNRRFFIRYHTKPKKEAFL